MLIGIGIDLCEIARMGEMIAREEFLRRFFTEEERVYIASRGQAAAQTAAGIYAAKEAALKAMGCGIALPLAQVGVTHDESGAPRYTLTGRAAGKMAALGGKAMHLSITHEGGMAAAVAILEG